jgi:hypothetical protein
MLTTKRDTLMLAVVWRLAGPTFDVDTFISRFDLEPDVIWYRGQPTRRGRVHETSGLSLSIDNADSTDGVVQDIMTFVQSEPAMLLTVQKERLDSTIDIGFTVGDGEAFTRSLLFPPELLTLLGTAGIRLEVSAYPGWYSEDEAERTDESTQL